MYMLVKGNLPWIAMTYMTENLQIQMYMLAMVCNY